MLKVVLGLLLVGQAPVPTPTPAHFESRVLPEPIFGDIGRFNFYYNSACGVSFAFPIDWEVQTSFRSGELCSIQLRPVTWEVTVRESKIHLGQYPVLMTVSQTPFEEVYEEYFTLEGERVVSKDLREPASPVAGAGWLGYEIASLGRTNYKTGGNAGAIHSPIVYLGNQTFSVVAYSDHNVVPVFYSLLRSLRVSR